MSNQRISPLVQPFPLFPSLIANLEEVIPLLFKKKEREGGVRTMVPLIKCCNPQTVFLSEKCLCKKLFLNRSSYNFFLTSRIPGECYKLVKCSSFTT